MRVLTKGGKYLCKQSYLSGTPKASIGLKGLKATDDNVLDIKRDGRADGLGRDGRTGAKHTVTSVSPHYSGGDQRRLNRHVSFPVHRLHEIFMQISGEANRTEDG